LGGTAGGQYSDEEDQHSHDWGGHVFHFFGIHILLGTLTGMAGPHEGTPSTGHDRQIGAAMAAPRINADSETS
jgi:hypothetical protein